MQKNLNKVCKLNWEASSLSNKDIFIDLIICVDRKSQKLKCKLCTKSVNIFLYISPRSAHSPNTLKGMVGSIMDRMWRYCSDKSDYTKEKSSLCQRLIDVGHNPTNLTAIYKKSSSRL